MAREYAGMARGRIEAGVASIRAATAATADADANVAAPPVEVPVEATAPVAQTPASVRRKRRTAPLPGAETHLPGAGGREEMYNIQAAEGKLIITPVKRSARQRGGAAKSKQGAVTLLSPHQGISIIGDGQGVMMG